MESNIIYHVYNRANGKELLFRDKYDYARFKQYFFKYILLPGICDIYAYCFLPNHFHLLASVASFPDDAILTPNQISLHYSNMFNAYAKYYNYKYQRKGSLFMRPFKKKALKSSLAFGKLIHYIHANPVHHGYCENIEDWPYNSYIEFLNTQLLINQKETVLDWYGGIETFIEYHKGPIGRKVNGFYVQDTT
jgi:REP element-mobilizing transposase RayT